MKDIIFLLLIFAGIPAVARDKDKKDQFPLTIKVLAADQVKTVRAPSPAPTNIQACAGENLDCTNEQRPDDNFESAQKAAEAWRAPDTHNAMLVEINGAQVMLSCTRSGGVLGRHLSACQILLPGEYRARDIGGGRIEVLDSRGKTIKYEISGTF
jgi:hypothetical protein